MSLAQQNQTDFERKYSDLTGSLAENYSQKVTIKVYSDNIKYNVLRIVNVT